MIAEKFDLCFSFSAGGDMRSSQAQRAMTLQSSWQTRRLMSWTPHLRQFIVGFPAIFLRFFCIFLHVFVAFVQHAAVFNPLMQFCSCSLLDAIVQIFFLFFLHVLNSNRTVQTQACKFCSLPCQGCRPGKKQ